mgnify:CR=1 FL=1
MSQDNPKFEEIFCKGRKLFIQGSLFYIRKVTKKDIILRPATKKHLEQEQFKEALIAFKEQEQAKNKSEKVGGLGG